MRLTFQGPFRFCLLSALLFPSVAAGQEFRDITQFVGLPGLRVEVVVMAAENTLEGETLGFSEGFVRRVVEDYLRKSDIPLLGPDAEATLRVRVVAPPTRTLPYTVALQVIQVVRLDRNLALPPQRAITWLDETQTRREVFELDLRDLLGHFWVDFELARRLGALIPG